LQQSHRQVEGGPDIITPLRPMTPVNAHNRLAFAFAGALAALGLAWTISPAWFVAWFEVPYSVPAISRAYLQLLADLPLAILFAATVLAATAAATLLDRRRPVPGPAFRPLPPAYEVLLYGALLLLGVWLSWRHHAYWSYPTWDLYWEFGEQLHRLMRHPDPQVLAEVQAFAHQYPHSASPLTPFAVALGMFAFPHSLLLMQILSAAATAASLVLMRTLARRLAPTATFWPVGVLFLTNVATTRNSFFIQLDAINGFFVLLFFHQWLRWRERPTRGRLAALCTVLTLGVLQKTTLIPLLAIPTLVAVVEPASVRCLDFARLFVTSLWTALVPALLFLVYLGVFGFHGNFLSQVTLMGTGWNEIDFSWQRFVLASGFLLCPYLGLVSRNGSWREPAYQGLALFVVLFFASMVAVRGPFWGRYYSHVLGCWLLLALPAWARDDSAGRRYAQWTFLIGVGALQIMMMYRQII
jgi:hypothetical protein